MTSFPCRRLNVSNVVAVGFFRPVKREVEGSLESGGIRLGKLAIIFGDRRRVFSKERIVGGGGKRG